MVNTSEISSVYSTLFIAVVAKYDVMWSDNEIDAETYAKLVGQASSQLVTLAAELVQKQEQVDINVEKTIEDINIAKKQSTKVDQEISLLIEQEKLAYTERLLKDKQAAKLGLDNVMKLSEASKDSTLSFVYTPSYEA